MKKTKFALNEGAELVPGMRMTFRNGFTISVQWHAGNYCEHHHTEYPWDKLEDEAAVEQFKDKIRESETAEIAVYNKQEEMMHLGKFNSVIGWLNSDEVVEFMSRVSNLRYDSWTGEILAPDELFKAPWKEDDEDEDA